MPASIPSEEEVLTYFDTLSNWGRWGEDDELGTLNFLSDENTKKAVALVQEGKTISCARTISWEAAPDVSSVPIHYMVESGEGWASGDKVSARPNQASTDFFGLVFHGQTITHIDSLAHFFWKGKMYNGRPAHLVSTSMGATVESVELAKDGIIARGVLVIGLGQSPKHIFRRQRHVRRELAGQPGSCMRRNNRPGTQDERAEHATHRQFCQFELKHGTPAPSDSPAQIQRLIRGVNLFI